MCYFSVRRLADVAVVGMIVTLLLSAVAWSAPPSADKINAYFLTGIAHNKTVHTTTAKGKPRTAVKPGINRIYEAGEIVEKFGEPNSVKESTVGAVSVTLPPVMRKTSTHQFQAEHWTWKCADGDVSVSFLVVGYGKEGDAKTKRLFLYETPKMKDSSATHKAVKPDSTAVPKEPPKDIRQWSDASGKFHVEAAFAGQKGTDVTLEKKDGSTLTVAIAKLSQEDREWVKSHSDDERKQK